jgi:hypothetical protein
MKDQNQNPVIYDLSVNIATPRNKTDYESDISQRGIDQFQMSETAPNQADTPPESPGLPAGSSGAILYYNGSSWVTLSAPSAGAVLRHNGTAPYWEQPEDC